MLDQTQVYDYGIIVPEGTDVSTLTPEIQAIIAEYKAEFPSAKVPGTVVVDGRQIVYVRMRKKLTQAELKSLFASFTLNWQVIGIRSAYRIIEVIKGEDQFGNTPVEYEYDEAMPVDKAAVVPFVPNATLDTPLIVPVYTGTDPIMI